jgi:hypothetical protein
MQPGKDDADGERDPHEHQRAFFAEAVADSANDRNCNRRCE